MSNKPVNGVIPILKQHKLACLYCGNTQTKCFTDERVIRKKEGGRVSFPCEYCGMSTQVYKSKNGYLSVQNNSHRLMKNIELGINRIKINDIFQNGNSLKQQNNVN